MSYVSRLGRGDRRRNARLARYREVVRRDYAVLGLDLADSKQVCVLVDHDSRVLARRTVRCRVAELGEVFEWARDQGLAAGFAGVVVACEPTGYRWKVVGELTSEAGIGLVCVQPLLVARARESEDFTKDKSDDKDALLIARLATQLHVYLPEQTVPQWSRLRHMAARRSELVVQRGAARQRVRDLIGCAWPGVLRAARKPLDSMTWRAAMEVAGCDPERVRQLGCARFSRRVAKQVRDQGGQRVCQRIVDAVFVAASHPAAGPAADGTLERAWFTLDDLRATEHKISQAETTMVAILDDLDLTGLVTTIPGLSAVSAAAILAETGDLNRFDSARAVVKHAGLCPRHNESGNYSGKTSISRRGRPLLRLAAWRAAWIAVRHNPVLAARYTHLTTRNANRLTDAQARVAVAGSLLRQLFVVITTRTAWNPTIASGHPTTTQEATTAA